MFDYINPAQTVQDLMVKNEWIEDDNANYIIPRFEEFTYDKENPGVEQGMEESVIPLGEFLTHTWLQMTLIVKSFYHLIDLEIE